MMSPAPPSGPWDSSSIDRNEDGAANGNQVNGGEEPMPSVLGAVEPAAGEGEEAAGGEGDEEEMAINPSAGTHTSSILRHPPLPSAAEQAGQPVLIRTSQLPPAAKRPKGLTSAKVILQLEGDLDDMARGWTQEEWTARRRLVQFIRIQDNNVVKCSFAPVRQQDYKATDIVVSCIFRDDKNECFITSVDTIYLLEAMVGVRFSVEEKNRIRRNLEGFKPITVSKSKAEAEPYFKLIMGFPNPKPRNIEKDVKVFPWKIVANSVKKIMAKYSATFTSAQDASKAMIAPLDDTPPKKVAKKGKAKANNKSSNLSISVTKASEMEADNAPIDSGPTTTDQFSYPSPPEPQSFDFSTMLSQNPSEFLHDDGEQQPHAAYADHTQAPSGLFGLGAEFGAEGQSFVQPSRPTHLLHHSHGHHRSHSDLGVKTLQSLQGEGLSISPSASSKLDAKPDSLCCFVFAYITYKPNVWLQCPVIRRGRSLHV